MRHEVRHLWLSLGTLGRPTAALFCQQSLLAQLTLQIYILSQTLHKPGPHVTSSEYKTFIQDHTKCTRNYNPDSTALLAPQNVLPHPPTPHQAYAHHNTTVTAVVICMCMHGTMVAFLPPPLGLQPALWPVSSGAPTPVFYNNHIPLTTTQMGARR